MAKIALTDLNSASEEETRIYDLFPSNLVRGLLRINTDVAEGYLALGRALSGSTELAPRLREMAILRVGALCGSAYERMQHIDIAHSVGVTDAQIDAVDSGDYACLGDVECVTLQFVDELVARPKAIESYEAALSALGEQDLATITLLVGHYMMTARLLETLEIDLDDEATPWDQWQPSAKK